MSTRSGPERAGPGPGPVTVTTDSVRPAEAFAFWQDLICDTFVQLSASPTTELPFRGRISHGVVGDVELTTVRAGGQHVRRTPRLIARTREEFVLTSIQLAGQGVIAQDGREARLTPGAMAFYDSTRPYTLHFDGAFEQLVVQVPRRVLPACTLAGATAVTLGADSTARLVADFLRGLARQQATDPAGVAALAPHAVALLTSALALASGPPAPSPAALDRERVMAHLAAHHTDPRLSADAVAEACHLSRRTLFRLFEIEPEGLGDVLRRLRVTSAQRLLRAQPALPLTTVAARCGFAGDASFHRAFRTVTGTTPAAYRRAAGERA
ncbi:transcriptional regulator, AraC family [Geodermatophilus saharensis]|uniref:Transcriptional regulator, AraC family n=1 Tax=Geodermatophilus saharensis TaxID=1137994 RepID=A0A239FB19_9ACTN|nr:transcriptional regulator, AraC family [Geodermatophilus saharensis]